MLRYLPGNAEAAISPANPGEYLCEVHEVQLAVWAGDLYQVRQQDEREPEADVSDAPSEGQMREMRRAVARQV